MRWRRLLRLRPVPSAEVRGITAAAIDGRCTNCETPLAEPRPKFCPECGQDTHIDPPSLRELWQQFTDTYLAPRGATWTTLKLLLTRPGELTAQYLTGRRRRYILPLKLFGLATVVMLIAMRIAGSLELSSIEDPAVWDALAERPAEVALELGVGRAGVSGGRFYCESLPGWVCTRLERRLNTSTHELLIQVQLLTDRMARIAGIVLLLMMPVFAAALTLLYRYRGMHYTEHLVFAVHLHAFWFLVVSAAVLLPTALGLPLLVLLVPGYAGLAFRRVYGGRAWALVWRGALLSALHLLLVALIVALTALVALLM